MGPKTYFSGKCLKFSQFSVLLPGHNMACDPPFMEFDRSKWPVRLPLSATIKMVMHKGQNKKCRHFVYTWHRHFHILPHFRYPTYAIFFLLFQSRRTRSWLSSEPLNTKNGWCLDIKKIMLRWPSNYWLWKIVEKKFVKIFVNFFLHIILGSVLHPEQWN